MPAVAGFISDGFDKYNGGGGLAAGSIGLNAIWNAPGGGSGIHSGRFGGQSVSPQNNWYIERNVTPSGGVATAFSMGAAIYLNTITAAPIMRIGQSTNSGSPGGVNASVYYTSGNGFQLYTGYGSTSQGTSAGGLFGTTGTWGYLELFGVLASGTGGSLGVAWNGTTVIGPVTGINTLPSGNGANVVGLGVYTQGTPFYFDDFYFNPSSTPLGPLRVQTLYPTANASVAWTPLTGSNYSEVNETNCDADTSYVYDGTVGASDLYDFQSLPVTASAIYALSHCMFARNTGASSRGVNAQCQSGATNEQGSTFTLGSGQYVLCQRADIVDPNTSAAWTNAAVNAVEAGPYVAV